MATEAQRIADERRKAELDAVGSLEADIRKKSGGGYEFSKSYTHKDGSGKIIGTYSDLDAVLSAVDSGKLDPKIAFGLTDVSDGLYYTAGRVAESPRGGSASGALAQQIIGGAAFIPDLGYVSAVSGGAYSDKDVDKVSGWVKKYNQKISNRNYLNKLLKERREADLTSLATPVKANRRASLVAGLDNQGGLLG